MKTRREVFGKLPELVALIERTIPHHHRQRRDPVPVTTHPEKQKTTGYGSPYPVAVYIVLFGLLPDGEDAEHAVAELPRAGLVLDVLALLGGLGDLHE